MKRISLMSGILLCCLTLSSMAAPNPATGAESKAKKETPNSLNGKANTAFFSVNKYLYNNSSTTWARIVLTSTSGGPNYDFSIPPNSSITTGQIADGVYNISITSSGPGSMNVWRCVNDLFGSGGPTVPYTYTGYNTAKDGVLIVTVV